MNVPARLDVVRASRGLAALLVVLYHVTTVSKAYSGGAVLGGVFDPLGFHGIDFFFVLSGFVITYAFWGGDGSPRRAGWFLVRRITRILPLYWVLTVLTAVGLASVPGPGGDWVQQQDLLLRSLFFLTGDEYPVIAVGWTLQYELLFYCVFALLMVLPRRMAARAMVGWMLACAIAALSRLLGPVLVSEDDWWVVRLALSRWNLEFGLGWGIALCFQHMQLPAVGGALLALGGALGFAVSSIAESRQLMAPDSVLAYGLPAGAMLLGAAALERAGAVRCPRWLASLGDASYSTYLVHYAAIASMGILVTLVAGAEALRNPLVPLLLVLGALGSGWLTYILVERPLLAATRRALPPLGAGLSAALVLLGVPSTAWSSGSDPAFGSPLTFDLSPPVVCLVLPLLAALLVGATMWQATERPRGGG